MMAQIKELGHRRSRRLGERNFLKSGGRVYVRVKTAKGWMLEHRYVMEVFMHRKLWSDEYVLHLNGDTKDNRPENLALRVRKTRRDHRRQGRDGD